MMEPITWVQLLDLIYVFVFMANYSLSGKRHARRQQNVHGNFIYLNICWSSFS